MSLSLKPNYESILISLKTILKTWNPDGIPLENVNHLLLRRFGICINPIDYGHQSLEKFFIKAFEKNFDEPLVLENGRIKLLSLQSKATSEVSSYAFGSKSSSSFSRLSHHESVQREICEDLKNLENQPRSVGYQSTRQTLHETKSVSPFEDFSELSCSLPASSNVSTSKENSKHKLLPFEPFESTLSGLSEEFCDLGDQVPSFSLNRSLRKGDILEMQIMSVDNPDMFHIRIVGPKDLMNQSFQKNLSRFTERLTNFYEKFKNEDVAKIDESCFPLEGLTIACPYRSVRNGGIEWRRGIILERQNINDFEIYFIDHGIFATVRYQSLRLLYKSFGVHPSQAVEARLAGLKPFMDERRWSSSERGFLKSYVKKSKKSVFLGMVAKRVEVQ